MNCSNSENKKRKIQKSDKLFDLSITQHYQFTLVRFIFKKV